MTPDARTRSADPEDRPSDPERVERYEALRRVARAIEAKPADRKYLVLRAADAMLGDGERQRIGGETPALDGLGELDAYATAYFVGLLQETVGCGVGGNPNVRFDGCDAKLVALRSQVPRYASTRLPVMLLGDRGVGKGQLVRAIAATGRSARALVTVSLAAVAEGLAESELFGHVKGAYTGATESRHGLIMTAHNAEGALYLDDVGECPRIIQAKLLTCLDDGVLRRMGSDKQVLIGRGHERRFSLFSSAQPGSLARLRPDLRDRLAAQVVAIPPLRGRGLDVLLLADVALDHWSTSLTLRPRLTGGARQRLLSHAWPGNVRQLFNVMLRLTQRADVTGARTSTVADVNAALEDERLLGVHDHASPTGSDGQNGFPTMAEMKERHIQDAIARAGGNLTHAARLLGMHRSSLQKRLRRHAR